MSTGKCVLFFYNHISSFVAKDQEVISKSYRLISFDFYTKKKSRTPIKFIQQFFFLLWNIGKADVVMIQFAGYHSLLPVLFGEVFGKPTCIVVGGTDAHYFPGIGYGNWQKKFLKTFTKYSLKWCSHILPKHSSLMQHDYHYDAKEPRAQGILARIPTLKTPFTAIPNGYDTAKWKCTREKIPNTFITVSGAWEYPFQQQLKGIDLILAVAPSFPDCRFVILGVDTPDRIPQAPDNVELLPPVKNSELVDILSAHEFYLQLSMAEGFPNALCEAMLCECIPIGSAVFSIPEIIGESGFILPHRDVNELKTIIAAALNSDRKSLRKSVRQGIENNFTLAHRERQLMEVLNHLNYG